MEGLLLGLASGIQCLSYCAPVLVTYLLADGKKPWKNMICLLEFLSGRLLGYLLFGTLAWCTKFAVTGERSSMVIFGSSYVLLSVMMIVTAFRDTHIACPVRAFSWVMQSAPLRSSLVFPAALGFLTGINLCPPFLLALTETAASDSMIRSLTFFLLFFIGTSVYFMPLAFLGAVRSGSALKTVAKMASALIALFYLYKGALMVLGGI